MRLSTSYSLKIVGFILLALALAGCQLPFGPRPAATTAAPGDATAGAGTSAATGEAASPGDSGTPGAISSGLLTQVAATLYAPLQGTWTAQAEAGAQAAPATRVPPTSGGPAVQPTSSGPAAQPTAGIAAPTRAPTQADSPTSAPQSQLPTPVLPVSPQAQPTAGAAQVTPIQPQGAPTFLPQATFYAPNSPPSGYVAQPGKAFTIAGVNLPSCGGGLTANFLILNNSGYSFESLSLQISDLSSGADVYGPVVSDAPFMFDDRVCAPGGYSYLASGYAGFVGAALNTHYPAGHTLQANFLLCTNNNLGGRCYPRSVEFVAP